MHFTIRKFLLASFAAVWLVVSAVAMYGIVITRVEQQELGVHQRYRDLIGEVRYISRALGEVAQLGQSILADQDSPNRGKFVEDIERMERVAAGAQRVLVDRILHSELAEKPSMTSTLRSLDEKLDRIQELQKAIINRSYEVHIETWRDALEEWTQEAMAVKLELSVAENPQTMVLKHQLTVEEAVEDLYHYTLLEGQILAWLLAKDEPLGADAINQLNYIRGFSDQAKSKIDFFFEDVQARSDLSVGQEWVGATIKANEKVEQQLETFADARRAIYTAKVIGEERPYTYERWQRIVWNTLEAIEEMQDKLTLPATKWLDEERKRLANMQQITLLMGSLFVGVMLLLLVILIQRVLRPVSIVTDRMTAIASGDTDVELPQAEYRDEIGQMLAALSNFKQAEEKLANQARLLRLGEEVAKLGHWYYDLAKGTLTWSDHVYTIHYVSPYEYTPDIKTAIEFYHPDDREFVQHCMTRAMEEIMPFEFIKRLVRADGRTRFVEAKGRVVCNKDQEATAVYGTFQDVTERIENERLLEEAKEKAEEATRLKSEFLANMSHEIRTPMNGIVGLANLLLEASTTPRQRSYAKGVISSSENLLYIVNDILDFSKIEAKKMLLEHEPFNMPQMVQDVVSLVGIKTQESGIELLVDMPPQTPRFVVGDQVRLRQVLMNLMSNAVKFTHEGHVLLRIDVAEREEDRVMLNIEVEDTGIGIPKERQVAIFDQFDQADSSTTRKYGGTGLGLAICRELVTLMHGKLRLQSTPGEGSTFTISLPLDLDPVRSERTPRQEYARVKGTHVLLVDDNEVSNAIIARELEHYGAKVDVCSTPEQGWKQVEIAGKGDNAYEIVFIDRESKGREMSGMQFARKIRSTKAFAELPLVMLTAFPVRGDGKVVEKVGFKGYLSKPLLTGEMVQMVQVLLDPKRKKTEGYVDRFILEDTFVEGDEKKAGDMHFEGVQVLLAEDNAINREVTHAILKQLGCEVTEAVNGKEACDLIRLKKFDVVFMDCQMPEMDGFEATQQIRREENDAGKDHVPIIAFTANAFAEDKKRCLDAGMNDYIAKPATFGLVTRKLAEYLPEDAWSGKGEAMSTVDELQTASHANEYVDEKVTESLKELMPPEALEELHRLFFEDTPQVLESMQAAWEEKEFVKLERDAHALRSSCQGLGCTLMMERMVQIEEAAGQSDEEALSRLMSNLDAIYEATCETLKA